jgi:hypothetical protein
MRKLALALAVICAPTVSLAEECDMSVVNDVDHNMKGIQAIASKMDTELRGRSDTDPKVVAALPQMCAMVATVNLDIARLVGVLHSGCTFSKSRMTREQADMIFSALQLAAKQMYLRLQPYCER